MKKSIIFFVAILISSFAFSQRTQALKKAGVHAASIPIATCPVRIDRKKGKVYSVAPGILKASSKYEDVNVLIKKTGGKARTQVNIYVNGRLTKKIKFDNGDYTTDYKTRKLTNVLDKNIKVEIINQSIGNTFSYDLKLEGVSQNLIPRLIRVVGLLYHKSKTIYTNASCTGKAKIVFHRIVGNAYVEIKVYEKRGSTYSSSPIKKLRINGNERNKTFTVNSSKPLKILIWNISRATVAEFTFNVLPVIY